MAFMVKDGFRLYYEDTGGTVFDLDVLACPRCGGRLRLIATVEDPAVVSKILAHLGLLHPTDSPGPAPPSADLRAAAPSHQ